MTTAAHTTPRALTAYLTRATWGLPEARRQELWDELEEHNLTRADHLILSGLTPTQATAQAIRELGPPTRVTLGMAKVYTMPKLILTAATLALALSASLYALAGGSVGPILNIPVVQQPKIGLLCVTDTPNLPNLNLPIDTRSGGKICYRLTSERDLTSRPALISVQSAAQMLALVGGTVTTHPDGRIEMGRPNGTWTRMQFAFSEGSQRYIFAHSVFDALINLRNHDEDIRISGFDQPALSVNDQQINLTGTAGTHVGNTLYSSLIGNAVAAVVYGNSDSRFNFTQVQAASTVPAHQIRTRLKAGEVIALITQSGQNSYSTDFGRVQSDGSVLLHAQTKRLRFVSRGADLTTRRNEAAPALLIQLSNVPLNDLKSGIFVPAQATSNAR